MRVVFIYKMYFTHILFLKRKEQEWAINNTKLMREIFINNGSLIFIRQMEEAGDCGRAW